MHSTAQSHARQVAWRKSTDRPTAGVDIIIARAGGVARTRRKRASTTAAGGWAGGRQGPGPRIHQAARRARPGARANPRHPSQTRGPPGRPASSPGHAARPPGAASSSWRGWWENIIITGAASGEISVHRRNLCGRSTPFSSRSVVQESLPDRGEVSCTRPPTDGRPTPARRGAEPACVRRRPAQNRANGARGSDGANGADGPTPPVRSGRRRRRFCRSTDGRPPAGSAHGDMSSVVPMPRPSRTEPASADDSAVGETFCRRQKAAIRRALTAVAAGTCQPFCHCFGAACTGRAA